MWGLEPGCAMAVEQVCCSEKLPAKHLRNDVATMQSWLQLDSCCHGAANSRHCSPDGQHQVVKLH